MKVLILLVRVLVGLVFILSGFLKAMDPYGTCYKIHDYLLALGFNNLDSLTLPMSFILNALEFTIGIMLVFNLKARLGIWLAFVLELIFTPLTLWLAMTNAVSDCGCFGDCLPLDNWATFGKNVVLVVLILFLVIYRKRIAFRQCGTCHLYCHLRIGFAVPTLLYTPSAYYRLPPLQSGHIYS